MKVCRLAAAAATAAVPAPVLVLATGTQANAYPRVLSKEEQCTAAYNVNYWVGGASYARTQWYACMA
ncbi:hypothetical protein ACIRRH_30480 [Kitasatospora sp. NPDC101235]|uniref:hypothetical protein n=1 Tax=Kitasatospora sp. NPDC101235 TaxID=3364101 RepID=UPI00380648A3